MDLLHKLGIIRGGAYKWKGSGKDRPIQAIMDNVYDTEKDLMHKEDFKQNKKDEETSSSAPVIKDKKGIVLYWAMLVLGLLFMVAIYGAGGISLWLFVSFFLWFAYIYNIKRSMDIGVFSFGKMIIFGIVVIVLSVLIVDAAPSDKPSPIDVIMNEQQ